MDVRVLTLEAWSCLTLHSKDFSKLDESITDLEMGGYTWIPHMAPGKHRNQ